MISSIRWAGTSILFARRYCESSRGTRNCSSSGVVTLVADLAKAEPGFQDLVIAHELLHLRIRSHGRVFKALDERACAQLKSVRSATLNGLPLVDSRKAHAKHSA
ncbi:MAG: M48 family metallopeptidase [Gemmatimonadaceae bacterium]|nr:M48 family metallopeptidase [Gemmatimonadaceae bacterium]